MSAATTQTATATAQPLNASLRHWADNPGAGGILGAAGVGYARALDIVILLSLGYVAWWLYTHGDIG